MYKVQGTHIEPYLYYTMYMYVVYSPNSTGYNRLQPKQSQPHNSIAT